MNWKLFFLGVGFLAAAYLFYRGIKGKKVDPEENDLEGFVPPAYIGAWGGLIISLLSGIIFIIKSLPPKI